jgi:hypothetical protein
MCLFVCLSPHEEALKLNANQAHVFVAALNVFVCLFVCFHMKMLSSC